MYKKIVLACLLIGLLTGCGTVSEVEDLPVTPEHESSHNEYQDKSGYLDEQSPATLDDDFIGTYIDVDDFGKETVYVQKNSSEVSSTFEARDRRVTNAILQNEYAYTFAKNNAINDISDIKQDNKDSYKEDVKDMNKKLKKKEKEYDKFRDSTKEE